MFAAGGAPSAKRGDKGGRWQGLLSFVARLRRLDERLPFSDALAALGAALFLCGAVCGLLRHFYGNPCQLAAFAGLVCLLVSALASQRGLARLLPRGLREKLFRRTPFELMFDETEMSDVWRRWARVCLLQRAESEADIQTIVQGLDPGFLDQVFRQPTFESLPDGVRSLLLPSGLRHGEQPPVWRGRRGTATLGGVGSLMARCVGAVPAGRSPAERADVLSPASIRELLLGKNEAKRAAAKEPTLTPVLRNLVMKTLCVDRVCDGLVSHVAQQGMQLATTFAGLSSLFWGGTGALLCTPWARRALGGLSGASDPQKSEALAGRVASMGTALCLLGAGISTGILVFIQKRGWRRGRPAGAASEGAASQTRRASVQRAVSSALAEPEREVSPDNSSAES